MRSFCLFKEPPPFAFYRRLCLFKEPPPFAFYRRLCLFKEPPPFAFYRRLCLLRGRNLECAPLSPNAGGTFALILRFECPAFVFARTSISTPPCVVSSVPVKKPASS